MNTQFRSSELKETSGEQLAFVLGALKGIVTWRPISKASPDDIIASLRSLIAAVEEKRSAVK